MFMFIYSIKLTEQLAALVDQLQPLSCAVPRGKQLKAKIYADISPCLFLKHFFGAFGLSIEFV